MKRLLLYFTILICPLSLLGQLQFFDATQTLMEDLISHGVIENEGLGPGISFVDYNNDGWDDISIPSSATKDFQFLRNDNGYFVVDPLPIHSGGHQARQISWVDVDNDGDLDFFATGEEGDIWFYTNEGNGIYENTINNSGINTTPREYWGNSWGDYDNDGFLDVFISVRDPDFISSNYLYKNNGNGTFTDVTVSSLNDTNSYLTFCSSFFDYDRDGDLDIYTANDKELTHNVLYRNNGDGTFSDVSEESGTDLYMSAMSTTIDDYNNDGWLDIYVTNLYDALDIEGFETVSNALLRNNGDGTFTDVAEESNTLFNSIGWGAVFFDADCDLNKDLYVSGMPDGTGEFRTSAFYQNRDLATFLLRDDIGFDGNAYTSIGNALGDIDNDGLGDIVVVNVDNEPINLWHNQYEGDNNWLKVNLEGVESNAMGIGAFLELKTDDIVQYNYTLCGEGYSSQNSKNEFFGLREHTSIEYLKVIWPSGQEDIIENLDVNQQITVREGEGIVLSTETFEGVLGFQVYPVPSSDVVNVLFNTMDSSGTLTLINMNGQEIITRRLLDDSSQVTLDLSIYKRGVYILKMTTPNGDFSRKIVLI